VEAIPEPSCARAPKPLLPIASLDISWVDAIRIASERINSLSQNSINHVSSQVETSSSQAVTGKQQSFRPRLSSVSSLNFSARKDFKGAGKYSTACPPRPLRMAMHSYCGPSC